MKKITALCIFSLLLITNSFAQFSTELDTANVRALIHANGLLFQERGIAKAAYEVPKDSGIFSIFSSSIWLSSISQRNGVSHISTAYNRSNIDNQFHAGPVDIVNQKGDTTAQFQRLWKINKSQIEDHIQNWNASNYIVPAAILDWPGNGNNNTTQNLAPYKDLNSNNIYEPLKGEYPIVKGDQAVFLMYNDYRAIDTLKDSNQVVLYTNGPLKVEVHLMLYAYDSQQKEIADAVFVEAKIFNRSNSSQDDHNDFHFSVYTDLDLGYPYDDYIATDSARNMYFVYNGDRYDENSPFDRILGYGSDLAAQGVKFLDYPLSHSISLTNYPNSNFRMPSTPNEYFNYQRGFGRNEDTIYYGGNYSAKYNVCVDSITPTTFMYTGNPYPSPNNNWTEAHPCLTSSGQANIPFDRAMIGGPQVPSRLYHGNELTVNFAYVFARGKYGANPIPLLYDAADTVQNFFDRIPLITSIQKVKISEKNSFVLYPNPSQGKVYIEIENNDFSLQLLDSKGSLVQTFRNQKTIDISNYPVGLYFVRITTRDESFTKKLLLVR